MNTTYIGDPIGTGSNLKPLVSQTSPVKRVPDPTKVDGVGITSVVQTVAYTTGTPSNPPNVNALAIAFDPNQILPTLNWVVATQSWQPPLFP